MNQNPLDSVYFTWPGKPDNYSTFYTGLYLRQHFLSHTDSTKYQAYAQKVIDSLLVGLKPFTGTQYFLNGIQAHGAYFYGQSGLDGTANFIFNYGALLEFLDSNKIGYYTLSNTGNSIQLKHQISGSPALVFHDKNIYDSDSVRFVKTTDLSAYQTT